MKILIMNQWAEGIYLPAINRNVLILGRKPLFWQRFLLAILPTFLVGFALESVWICLLLYSFCGIFFAFSGDAIAKAAEKGHYFWQEEQAFFRAQKIKRIGIRPQEIQMIQEKNAANSDF